MPTWKKILIVAFLIFLGACLAKREKWRLPALHEGQEEEEEFQREFEKEFTPRKKEELPFFPQKGRKVYI